MRIEGCLSRVVAAWLIAASLLGTAAMSHAASMLSGAALEDACRRYSNQAARNASEWIQRGCGRSMNLGLQIMDADPTWQYRRCAGSGGTTIDLDLRDQENHLRMCRGTTAGTGVATTPGGGGVQPPPPSSGQPAPPRTTTPGAVPPPTGGPGAGDVWDLVVINSVDQARSQQTYRIGSIDGRFTGQNVIAGNPDFGGETSGSAFRAVVTDRTGYRAQFFGRRVASGRVEGTGCDNRDRGFSFTLVKR